MSSSIKQADNLHYFIAVDRAVKAAASAEASDVQHVVDNLKHLKEVVASDSATLADFVETKSYRVLVRALLQHFFFEWRPCFSSADRADLFDFYFLSSELPGTALFTAADATASVLRELPSIEDRLDIARFLVLQVTPADRFVQAVFLSGEPKSLHAVGGSDPSQSGLGFDFRQRVQSLCSIPERVANALRGSVNSPGELLPGPYFHSICTALFQVFVKKSMNKSMNCTRWELWQFEQFVDKLCTSSEVGTSALAEAWFGAGLDERLACCSSGPAVDGNVSANGDKVALTRCYQLFTAVSHSALEKVTAGLFRAYSHRLAGTLELAHNHVHEADAVLRGILSTVLHPEHTKVRASRSRLLHLLSHKFATATARWKFGSYPRLTRQTNPAVHIESPLNRGGCISVRLNYVVAHLLHEHECLEECMVALASRWADSSFVSSSAWEDQVHVTLMLATCLGVAEASSDQPGKQEECVAYSVLFQLLDGIPLYLQSANTEARVLGMFMGEQASRLLNEGKPMVFEDFHMHRTLLEQHVICKLDLPSPETQSELGQQEPSHGAPAELKVGSSSMRDGNSSGSSKELHRPDQDANVRNEDDDDVLLPDYSAVDENFDSDDDTSSDESSLTAYDIDDDRRDIREAKRPKFLRDCINALGDDKDFKVVEQASEAVGELIRDARADELQQLALPLARQLLYVNNRFALPKFEEHRTSALLDIVVRAPVFLADFLTKEFYSNNVTMGHRLEILKVIDAAAVVLSEPPNVPPAKADDSRSKAQIRADKNFADSESSSAVVQTAGNEREEVVVSSQASRASSLPTAEERLAQREARTRRWGQRRPPQSSKGENRFANVAGAFFFPLVSGLDDHQLGSSRHVDLLGRDSVLLCQYVKTLAVCVEASRRGPDTARMTAVLLQVVLRLRFHKHSEVRQTLLFAVAKIYFVTSKYLPKHFVRDLGPYFSELRTWLEDVTLHDSNTLCRSQATVLVKATSI